MRIEFSKMSVVYKNTFHTTTRLYLHTHTHTHTHTRTHARNRTHPRTHARNRTHPRTHARNRTYPRTQLIRSCVSTIVWLQYQDLAKHLKKKHGRDYTKILWTFLNKSWKQHSSKLQLYSHLAAISKTSQEKGAKHIGLIWLGWILWHNNHCRFFYAEFSLYIYIEYMICKNVS